MRPNVVRARQLINSINIIQPRNSFYFSQKYKFRTNAVHVTPARPNGNMGRFRSLFSFAIIDLVCPKKRAQNFAHSPTCSQLIQILL